MSQQGSRSPSEALIALGRVVQDLKRVPRTGWLLRGVPPGEAENVAAHTCGMSLIALALAELVGASLDKGHLLSMCLLHDLAEARLTDLPAPTVRYLPAGAKRRAEREALADLLADLSFADAWQALWEEFEAGQTVESRLARDADRLDMLLQAEAYERSGRAGLDEFWQGDMEWEFSESAALLRHLQSARWARWRGR